MDAQLQHIQQQETADLQKNTNLKRKPRVNQLNQKTPQ